MSFAYKQVLGHQKQPNTTVSSLLLRKQSNLITSYPNLMADCPKNRFPKSNGHFILLVDTK